MRLRALLAEQRGAMLVLALAFMVIAVPITTATLAFVSTLSRHSHVQNELLQSQYGSMGIKDYAIYKLIVANKALINDDDSEPLDQLLSEPEEITVSGRDHTITWAPATDPEDEPEAEPIVFSTTKTVSPTTAPVNQTTTVTYTIQVHNIGSTPKTLDRIRDSLPDRFTYKTGTTVFEGEPFTDPIIEEFRPPQGSAGRMDSLVWVVDNEVPPGEHVTLVFEATTPSDIAQGVYCNIAWVDPGGHVTGTSPGSAKLTVGSPSITQCADEFLKITKEVCIATAGFCTPQPMVAVSLNVQNTYEYTIRAKNEWDQTIILCFLFDLHPVDLTWNGVYTSETTYQNVTLDGENDKQVNFRFHPNCSNSGRNIAPDQTRTFTIQAQGALGFGDFGSGVHQNAVRMMVALGGTSGPIAWAFSGLTADIAIYNVFWITIDNGMREERVEVWINADGSASVGEWKVL